MNTESQITDSRVALVLVSHSRSLAEAVSALAAQMTNGKVRILCAAGAGDNGDLLGTDAVRIMEAIEEANRPEGVLVLMDLGSALLSTDMALDLLDSEIKTNVHVAPCAFVEGAVAAAACAASGASIDEVLKEASQALDPKMAHLGEEIISEAKNQNQTENTPDAAADVAIPDPNGLHARPAAKLATLAGNYESKIMISNKTRKTAPASARSLVGLSSLGARFNDVLSITAYGKDAEKAVSAFAATIKALTGDKINILDVQKPEQVMSSSPIPVAPGVVFGQAYYLKNNMPEIRNDKITDVEAEKQRLKQAWVTAEEELKNHAGKNDILSVQINLLHDPELTEKTFSHIEKNKDNAAFAWKKAIDEAVEIYNKLDDPYLKGRATDVRDIGVQVAKILVGAERDKLPQDGKPYVLIAEDLTPSEALQCDPQIVLGVLDRKGGRTSHAAILLRAAGIPSLVGAQSVPAEGVEKIGFDGETGEIWVNPDETTEKQILVKVSAWQQQKMEAEKEAQLEVITKDNQIVTLMANVSGISDAKAAFKAGAKGVGLLRTELLFTDRQTVPDEEEQMALLSEIFAVFKGLPIVVRTLDAGGDKPLSYLNMTNEDNPFLGVRGIRLCLKNREFFKVQIRALLRAGKGYDLRVMLPMITEVSEYLETKSLFEEVHEILVKKELAHIWPVPLGVMIEVPAAAIRATDLAEHVDFFSIGTNDLTQYVLAAERGNPALEHFSDAVHPAVLELITTVAQAGKKKNRHVSVCGEAAGDPFAAALLLGAGVTSLSMGAGALHEVRKMIRTHSSAEFTKALQEALTRQDAQAVRKSIIL